MKKFTKILAVIMLVIMVAMTFASCGIFSLDLGKAQKRLNKKDYEIMSVRSDDQIEYMMEDLLYGTGEELDVMPEKIVQAYSEIDDECLNVFFALEFKNSIDAKEAYDVLENLFAGDLGDEFREDGEFETFTYGKKGKVIYFGTVQGCKDAFGFPSSLFITSK